MSQTSVMPGAIKPHLESPQLGKALSMRSGRVTVLCVDDNDASRYSVVRVLRAGGYDVLEATTGAEALRLLSSVPDLITLDVQLPDIDGFEVCRRIKADPNTAHVPILHVSATSVETEHRVRGLKGGADGYLVQPLDPEELLATVEALLRLKRAEREALLRAEDAEKAKQQVAELNAVLRDTVERLRIAQEAAHSGSWELDFETGRVIWSPEEEAVYGLAPGKFSGDIDEWRRMVYPGDLAQVESALQEAIDHRTEYHSEFRITRTDGAPRWIESFGRIFYNENGSPERIIGVNADISQRKEIEQALQRSEFRFKRLVDSNIIPIICANMNGITEANDAFLKMIGYTRDDLANRPIDWVKLTPPEYAPKDLAALEELSAKGYCTPFEKEFELPNGRRVPFLIGASVVNNSPLEWLCFVMDLSELKRAEGELRKAHDELERKVGERTEELAKSLARVESEMRVRQKAEEQLRELSARLLRLQDEDRRRIARDLHDSTGQTLTALKLTANSLENVIKGTVVPGAPNLLDDLNALADQALQEIRTISHLLHPPLLDEVGFASAARWYVDGFANRSGITATLNLSARPALSKEADLVFFRVLQESLTNVLRHSGSKAVEVCSSCDADTAFLSIKDYGRGIPSEKLSAFRETGAGVGVGLGGMKQRVRELGGHLTVESNESGTCVTATLPLQGRERERRNAVTDKSVPAA